MPRMACQPKLPAGAKVYSPMARWCSGRGWRTYRFGSATSPTAPHLRSRLRRLAPSNPLSGSRPQSDVLHSKGWLASRSSPRERRMVLRKGLEPLCLAAHAPHASGSTHSTTWAVEKERGSDDAHPLLASPDFGFRMAYTTNCARSARASRISYNVRWA